MRKENNQLIKRKSKKSHIFDQHLLLLIFNREENKRKNEKQKINLIKNCIKFMLFYKNSSQQ